MTIRELRHRSRNLIPQEKRLGLRSAEAAEAIGISLRTLHDLTYPRGPIKCARAKRVRIYPIVELERFLRESAELSA